VVDFSQFDPTQAQEMMSQQAALAGITGKAIVDSHPEEGVVRLKLSWIPVERTAELTKVFTQVIVMALRGMNLTVRVRTNDE